MTSRSIWLLGSLVAVLTACSDDGGGSATPQCGDGNVTTGEQCDDGNTTSGDGCSSTCQTEDLRVCGDGSLAGNEQCDDGNTTNGDGCSSTCQTERDPDCGNGTLDGSEGCDDGNDAPNDGCSSTCTVESGFMCTGEPSVCTAITNANGSCSSPFVLTLTNNGGVLEGTGSGSTTGSSDQVTAAECDGGDAGGGNDHIWQFTISEVSDVSIEVLGTTEFDAIVRVLSQPCTLTSEIPEFRGADGCSDKEYQGESEYIDYVALPAGTYYIAIDGFDSTDVGNYELAISATPTLCGNGQLDGLFEFCDDNDRTHGDGCDAHCDVEPGFSCDDSEPSVCVTSCGNGEIDEGEECDDGGTTSGDRCSSMCLLESDTAEVEPNDVTPQVLSAGNHIIRGALGIDDIDLFTFTITEASVVEIETYDAIDASVIPTSYGNPLFDCLGEDMDTQLFLYGSTGDVTDDGESALFADDDEGAGLCSYIGPNDGPDQTGSDPTEGLLQPGTYTIRAWHFDPDVTAPYYIIDLKITPAGTQPVTTGLIINEFMANPGVGVDTNCDGSPDTSKDEFIELVNTGTEAVTLAGLTISDSIEVHHTFPPNTPVLQPGKAFVVWGGGAPACPGVTDFQVASTPNLGLSNDDTISVKSGSQTIATTTYTGATAGVSSNRSPDVTGSAFVNHNTISATSFSPGKRADGSAF